MNMECISTGLNELLNLHAAAIHHRQNCNHHDCGVSLYLLKETAKRLLLEVKFTEKQEALNLINNWPLENNTGK